MNQAMTVSQLTRHIKRLLEQDSQLASVWVSGEISNFKHHSSGHMYFTLKDDLSVIKCVMFKSANARLKFRPEDGLKVVLHGQVSVYEAGGNYQLYPDRMDPDGVGSLYLAYEQLKERLDREGLFSELHKKPLPFLPKCVAVITSPTGAVIQDIQQVLFRRFAHIKLLLVPAAVQGTDAHLSVMRGIEAVNQGNLADVIILARGGGSIEDLWPFNQEALARCIRASRIPIISSVGHETDFTISDFAADMRAPTPSAAAELVVPSYDGLIQQVDYLQMRLHAAQQRRLRIEREKLERLSLVPILMSPLRIVEKQRQLLDRMRVQLGYQMKDIVHKQRVKWQVSTVSLEAISPLKVLSRGYAIATDLAGESIRQVSALKDGTIFRLRVTDGVVRCASLGEDKNADKEKGN